MAAIGGVRGFSASARDDKSLWKTWWEGSGATAEEMKKDEKAREHAHKHMLDDADKGGTLEEEREHIQQKCKCTVFEASGRIVLNCSFPVH
jgi:phosphoribosylformimino-5-aminoimidazole carboxamide ribonucleotide (ProFAR) isomerase